MKDEHLPSASAVHLPELFLKWGLNIVLVAGFVGAFYVLFETLSA
jgi:hypothetical protein